MTIVEETASAAVQFEIGYQTGDQADHLASLCAPWLDPSKSRAAEAAADAVWLACGEGLTTHMGRYATQSLVKDLPPTEV